MQACQKKLTNFSGLRGNRGQKKEFIHGEKNQKTSSKNTKGPKKNTAKKRNKNTENANYAEIEKRKKKSRLRSPPPVTHRNIEMAATRRDDSGFK